MPRIMHNLELPRVGGPKPPDISQHRKAINPQIATDTHLSRTFLTCCCSCSTDLEWPLLSASSCWAAAARRASSSATRLSAAASLANRSELRADVAAMRASLPSLGEETRELREGLRDERTTPSELKRRGLERAHRRYETILGRRLEELNQKIWIFNLNSQIQYSGTCRSWIPRFLTEVRMR